MPCWRRISFLYNMVSTLYLVYTSLPTAGVCAGNRAYHSVSSLGSTSTCMVDQNDQRCIDQVQSKGNMEIMRGVGGTNALPSIVMPPVCSVWFGPNTRKATFNLSIAGSSELLRVRDSLPPHLPQLYSPFFLRFTLVKPSIPAWLCKCCSRLHRPTLPLCTRPVSQLYQLHLSNTTATTHCWCNTSCWAR